MLIGRWLRQLREGKGLSQADMEQATGLLRGYISRVENGRTVPSLETLERLAAALEVPLYELFYRTDGNSIAHSNLPKGLRPGDLRSTDDRFLGRLRELCSQMKDPERELFLGLAKKLASRHNS
jgi:transcriptional regulator with XRE-family HTH domain